VGAEEPVVEQRVVMLDEQFGDPTMVARRGGVLGGFGDEPAVLTPVAGTSVEICRCAPVKSPTPA
jgi:hypothetical protein